ncbi:MAG: hypothetical protein ABW123_10770, partial [Cystobacter sp.]
YNFRGVASYQFWYYDKGPETKFLVAGDLPFGFELLCCVLLLAYLSHKVIRGSAGRQTLGLLFLLLTTVIAGYAYALNSGKAGLFIPATLVLYVTLFSLVIKAAEQRLRPEVLRAGKRALSLAFVCLVALQAETTREKLTATRGTPVPGLRGVLSRYGGTLNFVSDRYVQGQSLFSTYASALEVMNEQFQPTGMDYIIHVLGDTYRTRYLEEFQRSAPRYVTTIREDFSSWELWSKRANWFFYRVLLRDHRPVIVTPYSVLWERGEERATPKPNATVELTRVSDSHITLTVRVPSAQEGIADLSFAYASHWKSNRWETFSVRKIVSVTDGWSTEWNGHVGRYNLPEARERINIPVRLRGGEGHVTLAVHPEDSTRLDVNDLTVDALLPDVPSGLERLLAPYESERTSAANLTDVNWQQGLNRTSNIVLFHNTPENRALTVGAKALVTGDGRNWPVLRQSSDAAWIHVELERLDPQWMIPPNVLMFSR